LGSTGIYLHPTQQQINADVLEAMGAVREDFCLKKKIFCPPRKSRFFRNKSAETPQLERVLREDCSAEK